MAVQAKLKIILDPGHGAGKASNRGSLIGNEGDNNFYLAEEIKKALEPYEVQVDTTRKKITDNPSLTERSNAGEGYDVFLSLHTNAYNGKAKGSEVFRSLEHNNASNIALAKLINDNVAKYFTVNRGVKTRAYPNTNNLNYYGVMRGNKAKHVYLGEFGFHDNKDDIKVIINKRKEIAQAIAQAFIQHFNLKLKSTSGNKLYRVQIGAYRVKANAEKALKEAIAKGYKDAFIVEVGNQSVAPSQPPPKTIRVGSTVTIKKGAKSYEGKSIASWVYNNRYRVDELNGSRAVLDKQGIHTAFNVKDLELVS